MKSQNLLYNLDFFELVKKIEDESIDLIVTDPPYNFDSCEGGGFFKKRDYLNKLSSVNSVKFVPKLFLDTIKPKMKKFNGYFFCNKNLIVDYILWAKENKYSYDVLVMNKTNPIPAYNNHHLSDLEYIILIREKGSHFSKKTLGGLDDFRKAFTTSCKKGFHPAEKPVQLLERFIRVSSKEGDVIFDAFMGSGSTGVACNNVGQRCFIGCEIDEKYFQIAQKRILNDVYQN